MTWSVFTNLSYFGKKPQHKSCSGHLTCLLTSGRPQGPVWQVSPRGTSDKERQMQSPCFVLTALFLVEKRVAWGRGHVLASGKAGRQGVGGGREARLD